LAETERRILAYQDENADFIAKKAARQASDRTSALAKEEIARKERQLAAKQAQEEEEEMQRRMDTLKKQAFDSIARGESGSKYYKEMELIRAGAEEQNAAGHRLRKKAARTRTSNDTTVHTPNSPSYSGPFIPLPFAYQPTSTERRHRPDLTSIPLISDMGMLTEDGMANPRYSDIEYVSKQLEAHQSLTRIRAGGFDLREVWERDLRSGLEALLIPPMS
jgi:hypothetical protein